MEQLTGFKIGKGEWQGCILSPFLFSLYAEYIMQNAELDESQAGIKIACSAAATGDARLIPESGRSLEQGLTIHSSILAWRIP